MKREKDRFHFLGNIMYSSHEVSAIADNAMSRVSSSLSTIMDTNATGGFSALAADCWSPEVVIPAW